jgi:hypothetical protein
LQDDPPGALVEVVQLSRAASIDRRPKRATSMRIAQSRTPAGSLMSQLSSSHCTSFAVIAFGTLVS